MGNRMSRTVAKLDVLPEFLRGPALGLVMGRMVPFVGTAGITIEEMCEERVVVSIKNRRKVQNHIGTLHAAAGTLLAETASGFVVGMNVPDDRIPLMKKLEVKFIKRNTGGMRVEAVLTEEQRRRMREEEKGDVEVEVTALDGSGVETIRCEMIWAWIPKKRKG